MCAWQQQLLLLLLGSAYISAMCLLANRHTSDLQVAGSVNTATRGELVAWIEAADSCQQADLRLSCIPELARRLACGPSSLAGAIAEAALLRNCSKDTLLLLVGLMADAADQPLADKIASPTAVAEALPQAANPGSFAWVLERFSKQPAAVGKVVHSPWFMAAGREWRLKVYPGGEWQETAGHLSGKCSKCWWWIITCSYSSATVHLSPDG